MKSKVEINMILILSLRSILEKQWENNGKIWLNSNFQPGALHCCGVHKNKKTWWVSKESYFSNNFNTQVYVFIYYFFFNLSIYYYEECGKKKSRLPSGGAPTWIFFMARRYMCFFFFFGGLLTNTLPLLRQQEWDASDFNQNRPVLYSWTDRV